MKKKVKNSREIGITLIALVVTIIVMLILAGVTIALALGDNGLIGHAKMANVETRGSKVEEDKELWESEKKMINYSKSSDSMTLSEFIEDLVKKNLLTEDEKDVILGNPSKDMDAQYQIKIGSRVINFSRDISTLELGTYVKYNGRIWRVLYNDDTNGSQLILANVEENITLGYNDPTITEEDFKYTGDHEFTSNFKKGVASFNNIMNNFTETAQKYVNPNDNVVIGVRWFGYRPEETATFCDISDLKTCDYFVEKYQLKGSITSYQGTYCDADSEQLKKIDGFNLATECWSGFPWIEASKDGYCRGEMRKVNQSGDDNTCYWPFHIGKNDTDTSYYFGSECKTYGFSPIISVNPAVGFTGDGDGKSEATPFIIE